MGLIDYWRIARRRWVIIAGVLLLSLLAAVGYLGTAPTSYVASSSMYVSMATGTSVNDSYQGGLAAQQRVRSYLDLVTSATVAMRVIDELDLDISVSDLQGRLKATSPPATTLIVLTVSADTAEAARDLTNTAVAQFRRLIDELETIERDAAPAARVAVVDRAELPGAPNGPQWTRVLVLAVLAGLGLGCLAAFLRDRTDRTLRTSTDLTKLLPVPILGIIDAGRPGAVGETRRMRTRLMQEGTASTVLLTSLSAHSLPDIAMALAKSFADTGRKVVLVDADTSGAGSSQRIPAQSPGLAAVLRTAVPPAEALTAWPEAGVSVLPLGDADGQTPDLLASERFAALIATLRGDFEHVVIQAAPVAQGADAIVLAPVCEQTLGVVELGATTSGQLLGALATFGDNRLTGAVAYSQPGNRLQRLIGSLRI